MWPLFAQVIVLLGLLLVCCLGRAYPAENVATAAHGCRITSSTVSLPGHEPFLMIDGKLKTADAKAQLKGSVWTIELRESRLVVGVRLHQSAAKRGWTLAKKVIARLEDGTQLQIQFRADKTLQTVEEGWAWTRVPKITTKRIALEVANVSSNEKRSGGFDEVEVLALEPPPKLKTPQKERAVELDLTGVGTAPCNPLGSSFNVSFFEKGFADGLRDPEQREEFLKLCRELPITAFRFPGGNFAYGYPPEREAFPIFKKAGLAYICYNLWQPDRFSWRSEEDFFRFCHDAGIVAWFQINPGFWYDRQAKCVHKIAEIKTRPEIKTEAETDYLPRALKEAEKRVLSCKKIGVNVVWEIGNEDHVYFEPAGYAHVAAEFIKAIRRVNPEAKFAVCGDSTSWADFSWQEGVLAGLRAEGIDHFDYSSAHAYFAPGGIGEFDNDGKWHPYPWGTAKDVYESSLIAWSRIRRWFDGDWRKRLARHGFKRTRFAFTELNVFSGGAQRSEQLEHSMGRALGEAWGYPDFLRTFSAVFFHDLVRSGPGAGNWFQRLDYYPSHKPGCRYHTQVSLAVMKLMFRHAQGNVFHNSGGLCASRHPPGIYLTALNPSDETRLLQVSFKGCAVERGQSSEVQRVVCQSLDSSCYDYWALTGRAAVDGHGTVCLVIPPFTANAVWIREGRSS